MDSTWRNLDQMLLQSIFDATDCSPLFDTVSALYGDEIFKHRIKIETIDAMNVPQVDDAINNVWSAVLKAAIADLLRFGMFIGTAGDKKTPPVDVPFLQYQVQWRRMSPTAPIEFRVLKNGRPVPELSVFCMSTPIDGTVQSPVRVVLHDLHELNAIFDNYGKAMMNSANPEYVILSREVVMYFRASAGSKEHNRSASYASRALQKACYI